jgi:hypothetical protein
MDKIRVLKNIAFIVFVPSVIVGGYYGYKFIKNKYFNKDGNVNISVDKNTLAMREKYKDIKSFSDFHEGVKYQPSNSYLGYDLNILKDISNLEKNITLDELKVLYKISQKETSDITDSEGTIFLELYSKAKN